jgi:hypothetical protein
MIKERGTGAREAQGLVGTAMDQTIDVCRIDAAV